MGCGSFERTVRAIFRPCVTSSGSTRRKSRTQGSVAGSDPSAATTSDRTSFHSVICMARFAKQTQSCNLIGFGPAWKVARFRIIEARSSGSCARGTWWRSYTIWSSQRGSPAPEHQHTFPLSVVAANSLAAASAAGDSIMASVVTHASCYGVLSAQRASPLPTLTYRLLELFQELVCLLFLCPVPCRLHHIMCRQHRLEALLRSICGHIQASLGVRWGTGSGERPEKKRGGVFLRLRAYTGACGCYEERISEIIWCGAVAGSWSVW